MTNLTDLTPIQMIEALHVRNLMISDPDHHLDLVFDMNTQYDPETSEPNTEPAKAAVLHEKHLNNIGIQLFAAGYRLRVTQRFPFGTPCEHLLPPEYIGSRVVNAGYLATSEMRRLQYLIKR